MFLSHLLIDVGVNPDRPRPGRLWLRNVYHVHQRLCMAFPTPAKLAADDVFLRPFAPADFARPKLLFRIERQVEEAGSRSILVLSDHQPDWDYAFRNAGMMLAAPPQCRPYSPVFESNQRLRFRVLVNPSKRRGTEPNKGKRVSLTWGEDEDPEVLLAEWFAAKGERHGFAVERCSLVTLGWVQAYRPRTKEQMKFRSALLEGTLSASDPAKLSVAVFSGIGHAKAFGFGLLSVAPVN